MQSSVVGEFRMERCHRTSRAANENRHTVVAGEHLDVGPGTFDERGPDENGVEDVDETLDVDVRFEAVELTAVPVAADREVDQVEPSLVGTSVEYVGRTQDHPGTGTEHR